MTISVQYGMGNFLIKIWFNQCTDYIDNYITHIYYFMPN